MEIRQLTASTPAAAPPPAPPKTAVPGAATNAAVEAPAPPPKGGLPASQQVLSKLTPGDRAAIAGATGYHLSPTGAVTNVSGAVPPWSFIMAFAASRTAGPPDDTVKPDKAADDGGQIDVTV
ncbi:hypothetical protein Dvina_27475 [Dactylosporangium vinaceum]|uniref:Uncharacterized protein n=1 Tax=Dactylosporangium vinaceum TaxID=53362 RepID=A0ABV5MCC4_9ACTN|nr:hypothetical protein [Dactylosporangium vinaceum]UAB92130.1 hypothetical protein Dvina_27475 [Dactylosporangium vinaceum]